MASPDSSVDASNLEFYRSMAKARSSIVVPLTIATLIFFFLLLFLSNFTSVLDGIAFSGISWAYLYAFAQFFFVVILTTIYRRRMDAVETELRPPDLEETAAHYDDPDTWERHEDEIEDTAHHIEGDDRKAGPQ